MNKNKLDNSFKYIEVPPIIKTNGIKAFSKELILVSTKSGIEVRSYSGYLINFISASCNVKLIFEKLEHYLHKKVEIIIKTKSRISLGIYCDAVLALFLQKKNGFLELLEERNKCDVVFAHAIPLKANTELWSNILNNILDVIDCEQLLILSRSELVLTNPSSVPSKTIKNKHKRVLKKNKFISKKKGNEIITEKWIEYVNFRFKEKVSDKTCSLLFLIFNSPDFHVFNYFNQSKWVCSSLIYVDKDRGILFDILAPWDTNQVQRRLGIYSAVKNLFLAKRIKFKYSLCYGHFPYKDEIIRGINEASL